MNPLKFTYALLALLLPLSQAARGADLVDIYQAAEISDARFREVLATHRATLQAIPQARALLLPSINLTADSSSIDQSISSQGFGAAGDVGFNNHGYLLDLSQPIFRLDRILSFNQSESVVEQSATNVEAARQDLMIRVAERYFNALRAQDDIDFARAEEVALKRQLEQAEQRFEVGLIAITDVQEARAGFDRSTAGVILAVNQLDNANEALREVTGEYADRYAVLTDAMQLVEPNPDNIEAWTTRSQEQNLTVRATQKEVEVARQQIKVEMAGHSPTLDLRAQHGFNSTGGRFGGVQTHTTSVGVELAVPIFSGGLVTSRTREAHENFNATMEKLEQAYRQAQRQTREAYLGVISGISQVKALKQALVSSETALQATEAGFEVGTRTAVDLVASQRLLLQARRDYSSARYDYLLDTLRLKQAAGTLAVEDLQIINAWLE